MREMLFDEFVCHIEDEFGILMQEIARAVIRLPASYCRGEHLFAIAAAAGQQAGLPPATILESFGRACASARCGRVDGSEAALSALTRELGAVIGRESSVICSADAKNGLDLTVHYRDGAGCGDLIAGMLAAWGEAHIGKPRMSRLDLSPMPGSHVRFHLTGAIVVD